MLGRDPAVVGTVVRGDGRGRLLGFPTANLAFRDRVALPSDGIYAVEAGWGGPDPLHPARRAGGVASLGVRPTFEPGSRVLEAYLFDVAEDLYGERLRVAFVRRQRADGGSRRVRVIAQMERDASGRAILGGRAAPAGSLRAPGRARAVDRRASRAGGPAILRLRARRRDPSGARRAPDTARGRPRAGICRIAGPATLRGLTVVNEGSEDRVPLARETKESSSRGYATNEATPARRRSRSRC